MTLGPGRYAGQAIDMRSVGAQRTRPTTTSAGIGGVGFSPLHLRDLRLWLDASDASTITASSGKVSNWADKSGRQLDFAQSSGANQPSTGVDTQNGLNVISFTATSSTFMDHGTKANMRFLSDGTSHVVGIVARATNTQAMFCGNSQANSGDVGGWQFYKNGTAVSHALMAGSGLTVLLDNTQSNGISTSASVMTLASTPGSLPAASRSRMAVNGSALYANNTKTATPSTGDPSFTYTIGAGRYSAGGVGFFITGWIGELVMVSGSDANETMRQALHNYLNAKWAVY